MTEQPEPEGSEPPRPAPRTVIVGAGQAGLAMAYALMQHGQKPQEDFRLIDADEPGALAWKRRWHSLTLFTPAWYSSLRGLQLPGDPDRHPRADEIADYLDDYRDAMGIAPSWRVRARSVTPDEHGHGLVLATNAGEIWTRNVVAATGPFSQPRRPDFAASVSVPGVVLHSDDYTHPNQLPRGSVLIVGAGNTGIQIARELSDSHEVSISAGSPQRRLPQSLLGVDVFRWLKLSGLLNVQTTSWLGRRMSAHDTIIGAGLGELGDHSVRILPRAVDWRNGAIHFEDTTQMRPDSILWATGYRPGFDWLPTEVRTADTASGIIQRAGATPVRGLYALGAPWLRSRGSALIGGVSADAARIARKIASAP